MHHWHETVTGTESENLAGTSLGLNGARLSYCASLSDNKAVDHFEKCEGKQIRTFLAVEGLNSLPLVGKLDDKFIKKISARFLVPCIIAIRGPVCLNSR